MKRTRRYFAKAEVIKHRHVKRLLRNKKKRSFWKLNINILCLTFYCFINLQCNVLSALLTDMNNGCSFLWYIHFPILIMIYEGYSRNTPLLPPNTWIIWFFQSFLFERTWWKLFQKCIVRTKFDIYVLITITGSLHLLVDYSSTMISSIQ